jgi:hypothetical protein
LANSIYSGSFGEKFPCFRKLTASISLIMLNTSPNLPQDQVRCLYLRVSASNDGRHVMEVAEAIEGLADWAQGNVHTNDIHVVGLV